jgi:hypothetical protein
VIQVGEECPLRFGICPKNATSADGIGKSLAKKQLLMRFARVVGHKNSVVGLVYASILFTYAKCLTTKLLIVRSDRGGVTKKELSL